MEEITDGLNSVSIDNDSQKKNRIQVSNTKKPLFFYVNLAKRYMQQHNEVELSALGMAIATVVSVAEILKNNGLAVEKSELLFVIHNSILESDYFSFSP
ncbi:OLC1v1037482C1 [Oldenlandia corymbosa var. corymbosa]|uniref:OLC1v1037482C1 n=1 Tax=Oldenlandia corymbosa var. corymbosa TaxID=529605 RepID=A0AAV1E1Q3_OLDCO|nr:OLC1v1037482C1 [Oldenlandia corymbosa var. corymbosa]